jgi:hypothetical protein
MLSRAHETRTRLALLRQGGAQTELQYAQRSFQPVTFSSTGAKTKPVLDEGGFQQLLAAAYVLQQHNDSLRAKDPRLDAAWIFSQIAETETLVRHGNLDFSQAAALVGERLCKMTGAVSVSVCLLKDGNVECVAENGVAARDPGGSIAAGSIAATERLKNGRQFQSLDAQADSRLNSQMCGELGVRSLLAVPIQRSDETAGLIEVRWGLSNALHECDVRTCRLMTNLLGEMLGREAPATANFSPPLPPVQHAEEPTSPGPEAALLPARTTVEKESSAQPAQQELASHCRVCGRPFSADEVFCGQCSMPRVAASADGDGLQSKWASMWFMQQAQDTLQERRPAIGKFSLHAPPPAKSPAPPMPAPTPTPAAPVRHAGRPAYEPIAPAYMTRSTAQPTAGAADDFVFAEDREDQQRKHSLLRILEEGSRSEASSSEYWPSVLSRLRPLLGVRLRIGKRIATVALVSMLVFLLLATWLSWPLQSSPRLSWFESLLVDLGLAEVQARPAVVYTGNPNVRVWEDVHTALYYCPDSDLYGKTPGGRFSTQRRAQEDQFEPATRVACK